MAATGRFGKQFQQELQHTLPLYGRDRPWDSAEWVTSDDRVRGGASQSFMRTINPERARFCGHLDTKALGGAGFASQRSLGTRHLDLSGYDGIVVDVHGSDDKKYTLILKDQVLPKRPDGREQSTVSWEYDFVCESGHVETTWQDFKPTYRGRPVPDAEPLDLGDIKRIAIMIRSFFGEQEGCFKLDLRSISAARYGTSTQNDALPSPSDEAILEEKEISPTRLRRGEDAPASGWLAWLCSMGRREDHPS